MLVGNKKDLRIDEHTTNTLVKDRQVPIIQEECIDMAKSIKAYDYCECSAKLNQGVKEVLLTVGQASMTVIQTPKKDEKSCVAQ